MAGLAWGGHRAARESVRYPSESGRRDLAERGRTRYIQADLQVPAVLLLPRLPHRALPLAGLQGLFD